MWSTRRFRRGQLEIDFKADVTYGLVFGIQCELQRYPSELWSQIVVLYLGPVWIQVRLCHYRRVAGLTPPEKGE